MLRAFGRLRAGRAALAIEPAESASAVLRELAAQSCSDTAPLSRSELLRLEEGELLCARDPDARCGLHAFASLCALFYSLQKAIQSLIEQESNDEPEAAAAAAASSAPEADVDPRNWRLFEVTLPPLEGGEARGRASLLDSK